FLAATAVIKMCSNWRAYSSQLLFRDRDRKIQRKGRKMDVKSSAVLGVSIVVAYGILFITLQLKQRATMATGSGSSAPVGRFQIITNPNHAFVLDTATGQVWYTFAPSTSPSNSASLFPGFAEPKIKGQP